MLIEALIGGVIVAGISVYSIYRSRGRSFVNVPLLSPDSVKLVDPILYRVTWAKYFENIGDYGRQTAKIYGANTNLKALLEKTLKSKFRTEELTYERYALIINQTHQEMRAALENILPILEGMDIKSNRSEVLQNNQVDQVLLTCQSLNAALEELLKELSKLDNFDRQQSVEVEALLQNLQNLTDRVKNYTK